MLLSLSIRNIVIIEQLDLSLESGLSVFTGETGAGKSIILDALGLALGRRADTGLVRRGCKQGSATAGFTAPPSHAVWSVLADQGLEADGDLILLRRSITDEGRSRAFINDNPVSVGLLASIAGLLIEVHGQHDERGLLRPAGHRALLDAYGGHDGACRKVAQAAAQLSARQEELAELRLRVEAAAEDEEYDRHALGELQELAPAQDEERQLAQTRTLMMKGERITGRIDEVLEALTADGGVEAKLRGALRRLERMEEDLPKLLEPARDAFARAVTETAESLNLLTGARGQMDADPARLEEVEERLFALRALARKHRTSVDDLPALAMAIEARLKALESSGQELEDCQAACREIERKFERAVAALTRARAKAAQRLDRATNRQLKPLKLDRARFRTAIAPLERDGWTAAGGESIAFEVSTNLGDDFGPLVRIASGGELSRFVLALKVVLAGAGAAPTIIFDEVDRGVGGATASAVGDRLSRLSAAGQIIVVTHSPQVAARADHHWRILKEEVGEGAARTTLARVKPLDPAGRKEELARMLAGAEVTDEARAAAARLLEPALEGGAA